MFEKDQCFAISLFETTLHDPKLDAKRQPPLHRLHGGFVTFTPVSCRVVVGRKRHIACKRNRRASTSVPQRPRAPPKIKSDTVITQFKLE